MTWFQQLCRNTGLMIHNVVAPMKKANKKEIKRTVEEKKVNDNVTLRRTTIDEIEIKQDDD